MIALVRIGAYCSTIIILDDPCVIKNAVCGIFPIPGGLQEDLFTPSLIYLIGLIWAHRIALREGWGSMGILLQGVAVMCVRLCDLKHSISANNFPTATGFGPNRLTTFILPVAALPTV